MTITREIILSTLRKAFEEIPAETAVPRVLALWLEGADATGHVDPYSDMDLCCSVEAGGMDAATACAHAALASLGQLDLVDPSTREADFQFTAFHLEGTSPYLLIDFNVFVDRGSNFTKDDAIEQPLILFDRAGVVRFAPPAEQESPLKHLLALEDSLAQYSRIEKYFKRGDYLEAFGYYHKWLLTPLIQVLRMRYTPLHPDYYIVHISRHLPADVLRRLEDCFKFSSLAEMESKSLAARAFFEETAAYLREQAGKNPPQPD